jgi:hypothetical protein
MARMRAWWGVVAAASVAVAGCQESDLAGIHDRSLYVTTGSAVSSAGNVTPVLEVSIPSMLADGCHSVGRDLKGTVNGMPLALAHVGGEVPSEGLGTSCDSIDLTGPIPGSGDVTVKVWDASAAIEARFPSLFDQRTLTLLEPADGVIYIGDQVRLQHAPATDDFTGAADGNAHVDEPQGETTATFDAGDVFSFVQPEVLYPKEGPGSLAVVNLLVVHASTCSGARICDAQPGQLAAAAATATFVNHERGNDSVCYQCACACVASTTYGWFTGKDPATGAITPVRCSAVACSGICLGGGGVQAATCVASDPASIRQ